LDANVMFQRTDALLHAPFMAHSMRAGHCRHMIRCFLPALTMTALLAATPVVARDDQEAASARAAAEQGQVLPLGRLVALVQARAPYRDMVYLGGPKFDERAMRYSLKFLDGSRVIIVFVDARTGRVVGQQN
jgi:hypothetical protein